MPGNFELKANGTTISTASGTANFSHNFTVNSEADMELTGTSNGSTQTKKFRFVTTQNVQAAAMPGWMKQGISYHPSDATKIGLALFALGKNFVHIIGSFNDWKVSNTYLMKRDTANPNLFWLEISGLTPQQIYTFQYRTNDGIKIADPFSRLVLSPDDDPWINHSAVVYPNLPKYPDGQQYDVSLVQTGMPQYNWAVPNFTKPPKEKLVIYELLVRDFTEEKTWQATISKIPYLKSLGINAVELLPVMEFEGNNSWGYNPSFHFALDKAYGTPEKFKEFIDTCHQNGIAVILDIALNHATQRSPLVRLWNTSTTGGYGAPSAQNPYFNTSPKHAYNVNEDFNHFTEPTRYYVKRVLEQWINEYKIDGFRWDLTKGFTQNCSPNDEACTNAYQQDRVDVLKLYADYQWAIDPTSYAIFEHLGTDAEEQQWANYRANEGKGVLMWNLMTNAYNQTTMGHTSGSSIGRVNFANHGFSVPRAVSYAESHDEERLMFKNLNYGASSGNYSVKNLKTALERQKGIGALLLAVPGPSMIWQFGELGYDFSINRCENGSISSDCRTAPKPSAFKLNYDKNADRMAVYNTWAKILDIKNSNDVFNTKSIDVQSGDLKPRIYIWNDNISTGLKNVVIVANYTTTAQDVVPYLPYAGNWYNLMDNSQINFASATSPVFLQPGDFRILGNAPAKLSTNESGTSTRNMTTLKILQNPAMNGEIRYHFENAKNGAFFIYDVSGKLIGSQKVTENSGENIYRNPALKTGMYMVQLKTERGAVSAKVVVQ